MAAPFPPCRKAETKALAGASTLDELRELRSTSSGPDDRTLWIELLTRR